MKIVISPSNQVNNKGVGAYGTEEFRMNQIADIVCKELSAYKNVEILRMPRNLDWIGIRDFSNNSKADYHIALHTNAANGQARGVEVFHYVDSTENNSLKIARSILNSYTKIYTGPNRGLKSGMHLFEVNDTITAASCLIEFAFHDNWEDASFILENIEKIGVSVVQGIANHLGLVKNVIETPKETNTTIQYVDRIVEVPTIQYVDKIVEVEKDYTILELIKKIIDKIVKK